ncbi:MAG: hypothetical protein HYY93_16095 [Planctomycetes bacterium]|nr:hypothetical protein [Planctomycetota bacterium]
MHYLKSTTLAWLGLGLVGIAHAQSIRKEMHEDERVVTGKNLLCVDTWEETPMVLTLSAPLGSIDGHCCATCNEGKPCSDCPKNHSEACSKYRDKGEHYREIDYQSVTEWAEKAAQTLQSEYALSAEVPVKGATVNASTKGSGESSEESSSKMSLTVDSKLPMGTREHAGPHTCWKVRGEAALVVTLHLTSKEYWCTIGLDIFYTREYKVTIPPIVSVNISNDLTEVHCPCVPGAPTGGGGASGSTGDRPGDGTVVEPQRPSSKEPSGPSQEPPSSQRVNVLSPPALYSAAILVTPDREQAFAAPTRLISPDGQPIEITEVLVITNEGEKPVARSLDGRSFLGTLPPKPAKVIMLAGGTVAAVVSILGPAGNGEGGSTSPTASPAGPGIPEVPLGSDPASRAPFVDVSGQPTSPTPIVKIATSTPVPAPAAAGSTPPSPGASASRVDAPTFVRASDTPQALSVEGTFDPGKIDQYRSRIDYPASGTSTSPQTILMTDDHAVLVNDASRDLTGPMKVIVTDPDGVQQSGAVTAYHGRVLVTKEVVGPGETLVAKAAVFGLDTAQAVSWRIVLPEDGMFTAPPGKGRVAEGVNTVEELTSLSFPLSFSSTGPKQLEFFLEPATAREEAAKTEK